MIGVIQEDSVVGGYGKLRLKPWWIQLFQQVMYNVIAFLVYKKTAYNFIVVGEMQGKWNTVLLKPYSSKYILVEI